METYGLWKLFRGKVTNMQDNSLSFEIDDWSEIVGAKSNSSKALYLTYDEIWDRQLTGQVIRVEHKKYGCLFSYLVQGSGSLLEYEEGMLFELTSDQILEELKKYGFNIVLSNKVKIDDDQFNLLVNIKNLNVQMIRIMYVESTSSLKAVYGTKNYNSEYIRTKYLTAFNSEKLSLWLDNQKVCSESEFQEACAQGSAVNISELSGGLKGHNWNFLEGKVLNIQDILDKSR